MDLDEHRQDRRQERGRRTINEGSDEEQERRANPYDNREEHRDDNDVL